MARRISRRCRRMAALRNHRGRDRRRRHSRIASTGRTNKIQLMEAADCESTSASCASVGLGLQWLETFDQINLAAIRRAAKALVPPRYTVQDSNNLRRLGSNSTVPRCAPQKPLTLGFAPPSTLKPFTASIEIKGHVHATMDLCRNDFACLARCGRPGQRSARRSLHADGNSE